MLGGRRPRMRRWRRNCGWSYYLPVSRVPLAANIEAATLGGIAASIFSAMSEVGRASSVPGTAPPAPNGAIPMGVRSFLRHAFSDLPLAASLWALAAVALPGFGGLVILTLAGVRIGYRQAKAGFELRTAGIARFARPGPLGIVRSGSLVVVRSRGLRVVRPGASRAGSLLDSRLAACLTRDSIVDSMADAEPPLSGGALRLHVAGSAMDRALTASS